MASAGNPNQPLPPQTQQSGPPFDLHKLFPMPSPNTANLYTSPTYPPSSSYPPPTGPYPYHPHFIPYPPQQPPQEFHFPQQQLPQQPQHRPISYPASPSPNPNSGGARLMAMLSTQNPQTAVSNLDLQLPTVTAPTSSGASDSMMPSFSAIPLTSPVNLASQPAQPSPARMLSSKIPKGRHLVGENVVYDIGAKLQGEVQPQLEVTPITKYTSDPGLVLGRQIAVNRTYICYGLKMGNIRILNINTALRSLLRGHTQRVTDMAFFAEDVHLLASASIDGRVFIWKINEGPDEENEPQITAKAVVAVQIVGEWESVHPRLCWHPHKQEILMVAIGNYILKIDTTRFGRDGGFLAEEPLKCSIEKLIDGIQLVGKHDGEVTELSMCQWMTSRLASASIDGTVMVWEERNALPVATLKPHNGNPVNSVTFLTASHRPDHIVLITAGLLNREVKIWTTASEEGWLLPGDAVSWLCIQTLELKSSSEAKLEEAFFNQVIALPRTGLYLLANAKKNAIYVVHIDYGNYPAATRMDYIAEFTVTMPILSLTGTSDSLPDGGHIIQVYCVQTQAIQQYALELSQCLPPPLGNKELEKTESNSSCAFDTVNSDGSSTAKLPHGGKPTETTAGGVASIPHTLPSSSGSVPAASHPVNLASSEVSSLPEVAISGMETKSSASPYQNSAENFQIASPPIPSSPTLSRKSSGFRSPPSSYSPNSQLINNDCDQSVLNHLNEQRPDTINENLSDVPYSEDNLRKGENNVTESDNSVVPNPLPVFKHPIHLVTPSEILSTAGSSSENTKCMIVGEAKVQDSVVNNGPESINDDVKVVGESGTKQNNDFDSQKSNLVEKKERAFYSQASDIGIQMAGNCCVETYTAEGIQQSSNGSVTETQARPADACQEEVEVTTKDVPTKVGEPERVLSVPQSPVQPTKGKRQKAKNSQVSGTSSPYPSTFNSTESSTEPSSSASAQLSDDAMSQLLSMQEMLEQLMSSQKELQKQMTAMISVPVTKEGKRIEASLGRSMEKVVKANADALWARFQEDNVKREKLERERTQHITNFISNCTKDFPSMLEKTLKKELATVGPSIARAIAPLLEKTVSSAITESFQKGVGEKAVNQLENSVSSKLDTAVARQIQTQFQTSGKQALQDALRSTLEASIIPAFEMSCKSMFEQVDATFQKGLAKHTDAAQKQFESTHSPLAIALREAINSASSITQTLSGELAENQQKLLAIAAASANSKVGNPLVTQMSNGPLGTLQDMAEAPLDPTKELSRLIAEHKFEEAFTGALHRNNVSIVSWLCSQVDLPIILSTVPQPLSQGVLLALFQQLACDIGTDTLKKLGWMTDVAVAINPTDHRIAMHVRPIFEQVYQILGHQLSLPITSNSEANSIRILMHVATSLLSCK